MSDVQVFVIVVAVVCFLLGQVHGKVVGAEQERAAERERTMRELANRT